MKRALLLPGSLLLSLVAASANATLIDFNSLSEGEVVSSQFAGVTFSAGPGSLDVPNAGGNGLATNSNMQVTSTDLGGLGTPSLVSGMILRTFDGWLDEDGDSVFVMTFATGIESISVDFAGISTASSTAMYAYAGGTTHVASITATGTGQQTLTLSGLGNATQVAITAGDFFDWVGVDNINYTPASTVPEPATMAVLGIGAAAMLRRRKRS